jgi:NAD+ diphosphatase
VIVCEESQRAAGFVSGVVPPEDSGDEPAWWFVVREQSLLLWGDEDDPRIPEAHTHDELDVVAEQPHFLGILNGRPCWAAGLAPTRSEPVSGRWDGLRSLFAHLPEDVLAVAGTAMQVVAWDQNHRFCGRCGVRTEVAVDERVRRCPECGLVAFPRISPAIIVLIERDGAILMARHQRFPEGMYGLIAGFVEPGETLEEAARREIMEEVGLTVSNLQYAGSQPWPFPHSLMVGFTARWESGEIQPDPVEIEDARWFRPDALPVLPSKMSIARRLIDAYVAQNPGTQ